MLFVFLHGNYGLVRYMRLRKQKHELEAEIAHLQAKQKRLLREKKLLQSDYQYIEKILREKFRMSKKNEKVFVISPPKKK